VGLERLLGRRISTMSMSGLRRVSVLIGTLDGARQRTVKRAVGYAFDWPELKVL